jgi:hypothetical protein
MTEDQRKQFLGAIRRGVSLKSAAISAGSTYHAVRSAMAKDADFKSAHDKAQADAEVLLVAKMHELAQTDHRAIAWLLERINPRRYHKGEQPPMTLTQSEVRKLWGGR